MPIRQPLLNLGNRLARIQVFGADLGTVHNRVTAVQFEGVVQFRQALGGAAVPTVLNPTKGLHQNGRTEILVRVPPITGTGGRAAGAEDAFVHAIEFGSILARLQKLGLSFGFGCSRLQPGFNAAVLFVKVSHVGDQVFDDVHVRKRIDFGGLGRILLVNVRETRESILSVNVHGARSADSFATRASKGECGILLVFDFNESVQHHGSALVQIHGICAEIW